MLKRHWVCLALLCSIWSTIATAQAVQAPPSPGGTDEVEHEAIRRLKSGYEDAVRNNRIDALAPYFHSDFHGVMVTGRAVNSVTDVQQSWRDVRGLIGEGGTYTMVRVSSAVGAAKPRTKNPKPKTKNQKPKTGLRQAFLRGL